MKAIFRDYFVVATHQLGCNEECVAEATANKWKNFSEVMPKCGCGTGAWKIQTTEVNNLAAVENVYGDLESLNEVDVTAIQSALIRLDM